MRAARVSRARLGVHPGRLAPLPPRLAIFLGAALALLGPLGAPAATVEIENGPLVLGRAAQATAFLSFGEPAGEPTWGEAAADAPLRVAASAGRFGLPERVGPGLWRAEYTPPASRFPQVAVVAIWREGAEAAAEVAELPLHGATRLPVKAAPGTRVNVEVGGRTFGPVTAGPDGAAEVPLTCAPGVEAATVRVEDGGPAALRKVKLQAPGSSRLLLLPPRPPAAGEPLVLTVVHLARDQGELRVTASAGTLAPEQPAGPLHRFRWTPPPGALAEVTFSAAVERDAISRAQATVALPPPPPRPSPARAPAPPPPAAPLASRAAAPAPAAPRDPAEEPAAPDPGRHHFLLGSRAGWVVTADGLLGPRAGLELWSSFPPAALPAGWGFTLGMGSGSRPASSRLGGADVTLVPLALRAAWELRLGSWFVGRTGAGLLGAFASLRTPAGAGSGFGHGGQLFLSTSLVVRSAELFVEASAARAPVRTGAGPVEAGGLAVETGFRVGTF